MIATTSRDPLEHPRRGPDQQVGRLQRLDPADEREDDGIGRQAHFLPRGLLRARTEQLQVHTRIDHADLRRRGAVQVDQLAGLVVGVGEQPVRGLDDLLLTEQPRGRFGYVVVREAGVLHLGHRVHGVDQWDRPTIAGEQADLSGQPVMRVDDVVPAGLVDRFGAQDGAGERAQLRRELVLRQALVRAGGNVADHHAGQQLDAGRQRGRGRPGEHVDLDAQSGQLFGQLDDVHVHAAGVAGSGLVER